jgi:hypothetical protein
MKTSIAIIALSIGCVFVSAQAQPVERVIDVDDFIGPFKPTPESRAEARKEALAGYAWFSRQCRETKRGAALTQCIRQARQDRDNQLAYADSRRK